MNAALETTLPDKARTFFHEGVARLESGHVLDALAFFDGLVLQFGPHAATPELLRARGLALEKLGRDTASPLPGAEIDENAAAQKACNVCHAPMRFFEQCHDKDWLLCPSCGLLQYAVDEEEARRLDQGEPSGAKQPPESLVHRREAFFCDLFLQGLGCSRVLLYGAGWSLVPEYLLDRGVDAVGCDLWRPLIEERSAQLGPGRFLHRDELPESAFDLISAFEVFEHFIDPLREVGLLVDHLAEEGAIVGSTDFWHGGSLELHPNADASYWRHRTHVTAWTFSSMRHLARHFRLQASFFKVDRPGFGAKVFFVLHRGEKTERFVASLPAVIRGAF